MIQESAMLAIRNNSDTLVLVLHEIYGINEHMKEVCRNLAELGYDVVCPDLLDGKPSFSYEQQEEAYRYFLNFVGFESAVKKATFLLRQAEADYKKIILVGYSVGATIAWLCSEKNTNCNGMIGYYGSRIRKYLEVTPSCPMLLFFPEEEASFDPKELRSELIKKENVEVHILEGSHGFADPFSGKYNKQSAEEAEKITQAFMTGLVNRQEQKQ